MRMRIRGIVVASLGVLGLAVPASAQSRLELSVAGGLTPVAQGDWDRGYAGGAHAQIAVTLPRALGPLGVRGEAFVHGFRRETFGDLLSRRTTLPGAAASAVLPIGPATAALRPYLLAGGGTYRTEVGGGGPEWHFGLSGGGGVQLGHGRFGAFVEARLHQVYDGSTPRLVPVSLGLRF